MNNVHETTSAIGTPYGVYETLSLIFDFPDHQHRLWWHSTAPMFAAVLHTAGYHVHDQYRHLGIFKKHIIPYLGAYPAEGKQSWASVLTRYGIPIELSLNCTESVVRYTYEPIHERTGTRDDPHNTLAILDSIQRLVQIQPGIDLAFFSYFKHELVLSASESAILDQNSSVKLPVRTQNKLALDLKGNQFALKVYFYPQVKSAATGISAHDLIFGSVANLSQKHSTIRPAFEVLCEYVASRDRRADADAALRARLLSCDLLDPAKSRVKIYLLEKTVSLSTMEDLWTLGGRRTDSSTMDGLELIRELWNLLEVPSGFFEYPKSDLRLGEVPDEQLPFMANFTLHHGNPMPEPQIYFTVFGMRDVQIANALTVFFQNHGYYEMAAKYRDFLHNSYPNDDFESLNYLHTYVSFSYRGNKPYLSVYLHTFESGHWPVDSPTAFDAFRRCDLAFTKCNLAIC
uniref:Tryptophan dimethylallyltransferase n=1 Tax=Claviceps gigantea TaxID=89175 RepID=A0A2H4P5C7_9HYPO|nr:DmaW [Claviceps gigantea]